MQHELAVVNAGVAAYIDHHFVSLKLPVGLRKLARRNGAVIDKVVLGAGLRDNLSGEGERSGRGQHGTIAAEPESGGGGNVVEASSFCGQIVVRMAGVD